MKSDWPLNDADVVFTYALLLNIVTILSLCLACIKSINISQSFYANFMGYPWQCP